MLVPLWDVSCRTDPFTCNMSNHCTTNITLDCLTHCIMISALTLWLSQANTHTHTVYYYTWLQLIRVIVHVVNGSIVQNRREGGQSGSTYFKYNIRCDSCRSNLCYNNSNTVIIHTTHTHYVHCFTINRICSDDL